MRPAGGERRFKVSKRVAQCRWRWHCQGNAGAVHMIKILLLLPWQAVKPRGTSGSQAREPQHAPAPEVVLEIAAVGRVAEQSLVCG